MRKILLIVSQILLSAFSIYGSPIDLDSYLNEPPILVPKGNSASVMKQTDWSKFKKALDQIMKKEHSCVIKQAAQIYDVDPIAIIGSIIAEHTYNVNIWDIGQNTFMWMAKRWIERFEFEGKAIQDLLLESNYKTCKEDSANNFDLWNCYNHIWIKDPRNKKKRSIKWAFFNPMGSGYTYGYGQLGPVRALMVTDLVHEKSGFDVITIYDPSSLYETLLNPEMSIHYVAATNRKSIDIYKKLAQFDISQNPGVIATLYNLGNEERKARDKYNETINRLKNNTEIIYPKENFYGWLVNEKENEIRNAYNKAMYLDEASCSSYLQ